ncbi:MAG TPA: hypothetical protein DCQ14_05760 [Firmicutes bacterium]|nr:hypothetical protein [Bacillota bacterium]
MLSKVVKNKLYASLTPLALFPVLLVWCTVVAGPVPAAGQAPLHYKASGTAGQFYEDLVLFENPPGEAAEKPFILDVRNADLRDVLSALALRMEKTIILVDEPVRVTFQIEGVSPKRAMELLLQREGYDYLEDNGLILVGSPERLHDEYFDQMAVTRFSMRYIGTAPLLGALDQFGVQLPTFTVDTNPRTLWVQGTPRELGRVKEIIGALDRPENVGAGTVLPLERFDLQHMEAETIIHLLPQLGIIAQPITVPAAPRVFWIQSTPDRAAQIRDLIAALDHPENAALLPNIFIYSLRNISAAAAQSRLEEMALFDEVETMTFRFPEISQELLVITPPHLREQVYTVLGQLDEARRRVRRPVESATSRARLIALRTLLAQLTDVPISRLFISDNLTGDLQNPYYILWVEDTPDNIQKVLDMLAIIDAPRQAN